MSLKQLGSTLHEHERKRQKIGLTKNEIPGRKPCEFSLAEVRSYKDVTKKHL